MTQLDRMGDSAGLRRNVADSGHAGSADLAETTN